MLQPPLRALPTGEPKQTGAHAQAGERGIHVALGKKDSTDLFGSVFPGNEIVFLFSPRQATKEGTEFELLQLPYEEDFLLNCVDNQVRGT